MLRSSLLYLPVPAFRCSQVIVAFLLTLMLGIGGVYVYYLHGLSVQSRETAKQRITRIEQVLTYAHMANGRAAYLIGAPCRDIWQALRKAAAETSFVRTINLVQDNVIYCSSLSGDVYIDVSPGESLTGNIRLLSGNPLFPDRPVLSVRDVLHEGTVISNIDRDYLALMMSMEPGGGKVLLQVVDNWLDEYGRFHAVPPPLPSLALTRLASAHYPLVIYVGYPATVAQWWAWVPGRWGTLVMVLVVALLCALSVWYRVVRVWAPYDELVRGVAAREFVPFVQPVMDAGTRALCGVEVLMRWQHPTAGVMTPDLFIPQAEVSGLIVPMTSHMMDRVARVLAPLQEHLPARFHIGFNISAAHFTTSTLAEDCQVFLSQFPPGRVVLVLELTERELLPDEAQSRVLFWELAAMGVQFALDDFGTGHAGLAYLRRFPVDILKLDQSFVRGIGQETLSQLIVDNVADLGEMLGLVVVAEGVETRDQADYLTGKGVNCLQGYLFSPPVALEEFVGILPGVTQVNGD